jgi:tRNA-specific 2-thiouridylase
VKIRYKAQDIPAVVNTLNGNRIHIKLDALVRDITPGQAAVLYNGDICLGGGIISNN